MREIILDLIKQGRSKTEICEQLEITKAEFDKHLSIHNLKNYQQPKSNSDNVTVNYTDKSQEKDLTDHAVDIVKVGIGVATGMALFDLFDD